MPEGHMAQPKLASTALSRFKVLDLTRVRPGPTCVRQLADWGAPVIKIEMPPALAEGDPMGGPRQGPDRCAVCMRRGRHRGGCRMQNGGMRGRQRWAIARGDTTIIGHTHNKAPRRSQHGDQPTLCADATLPRSGVSSRAALGSAHVSRKKWCDGPSTNTRSTARGCTAAYANAAHGPE